MNFKKFGNKYILIIDKGEEILNTLKTFCLNNNIKLGTIYGLGATNQVKVGLFDPETKKYTSKEFSENFEISPLCGNISTMNGEVYLHCHINLCDQNHHSFGGHLNSAIVSVTVEIIIDAIDGKVDRKFNEEIGLNLYQF